MAFSRIQKTTTFDLTGAGTQVKGTLPGNVSSGNTLILAYNVFTSTVSSITDTQSNTYVPIGTAINGSDRSYLYYVAAAKPGSTVVTINLSAAHVSSLGLYEYSGPLVAPLDQSSIGSALTSANCSPGAMTPAAANSLIFSLGGDFVVGGTAAVTAAPGYTLIDQQDSTAGERFYTEELFQGAAASTNGSFTLANAANNRAIAAVFKSAQSVGTFSDNFNAGTLNTSLWNTYSMNSGTAIQTGGMITEMVIANTNQSWAGIYSKERYNLTGGTVFVQVGTPATGNVFFDLTMSSEPLPSNNFFSVGVDAGKNQIQAFQEINAGSTMLGTATYDANAMRWWRLREVSGSIFYEYSSDTGSWTTLFSGTSPFPTNSLYVVLDNYEYNALSVPNTPAFDNFNTVPVANATFRNLMGVGL